MELTLEQLLRDGVLAHFDQLADADKQKVVNEFIRRGTLKDVDRIEGGVGWREPVNGINHQTLRWLLENPLPAEPQALDDLAGLRHNVGLTAPYKTGKTTLAIDLASCMVDQRPFLNRSTRLPIGSRVGWLNAEMERRDWEQYAITRGPVAADRWAVAHLRGMRLNLMDDHQFRWLCGWITNYGVTFLVVDSWRRLCMWAGLNENKNSDIERLTDRIDHLREESPLLTFLAIAHTGRGQVEEGSEHARGATAFDDWVDSRWVLTRNPEGDRFMHAEGRGVRMEETQIVMDDYAHFHVLGEDEGGGSRAQRRRQAGPRAVADIVNELPGKLNKNAICDQLRDRIGESNRTIAQGHVDKAVALGLVHWVQEGQSHIYHPGTSVVTDWMKTVTTQMNGNGMHDL